MSEAAEESRKPSRLRRLRRKLLWASAGAAVATAVFTTVVVAQAWEAFGKAPEGERRERMEASGQWGDGVFENPQALWNDGWGSLRDWADQSEHASPESPLEFPAVEPARFASPPASGLRVTWLGHSTVLIEQDGATILTDPVWGERTSPLSWMGPERWYPPLIAIDELPPIDAVLISHDHYDHLDHPSIVAMKDWDTTFVCPLGVGAHLEYWGVPAERIVELDWHDTTQVGPGLEVAMVPSRHASGRHVFDQNRTLWGGYALLSDAHRVYFSGDTGLFPAMTEIGERYGPFDLTMIEVGAYGVGWPDWHIGPEQAIRAHGMVRGKAFMPIHWGLFNLASHGWTAPIERTLAAAEAAGAQVFTPHPGQSFEPSAPPKFERWWPELPYKSAAEYPIVSTKVDENSPVYD